MSPYDVVRDFESALCEYTSAPYAVTTNSCTMALLIACSYWRIRNKKELPVIWIPNKTYVSVPMSIIHAGCSVAFDEYEWDGNYDLEPTNIVDSARRFTYDMYEPGKMICCSFHASKILGDTQGGCVLTDDPVADRWLRKARFDGRTEGVAPKDDTFDVLGWHCYMSPDVAARLLLKLSVLPKHNEDLPNDDYPALDQMGIFK